MTDALFRSHQRWLEPAAPRIYGRCRACAADLYEERHMMLCPECTRIRRCEACDVTHRDMLEVGWDGQRLCPLCRDVLGQHDSERWGKVATRLVRAMARVYTEEPLHEEAMYRIGAWGVMAAALAELWIMGAPGAPAPDGIARHLERAIEEAAQDG